MLTDYTLALPALLELRDNSRIQSQFKTFGYDTRYELLPCTFVYPG